MKAVTIITQIGSVVVEVSVKADSAFHTLGVSDEMVEVAMCNVIAKEMKGIGGKLFDPKTGQKPHWPTDN